MGVRQAELKDVNEIVSLASIMHKEGAYADIPFNPEMYADFLKITLAQTDQYCLFVYEKDERIVGGLMGTVFCFLFSPLLQASDMGFFVLEAHRGGNVALRLEQAYTKWALSKGAVKIRMSVSTGSLKAGVFFEKIGYTHVGGNYYKQGVADVLA